MQLPPSARYGDVDRAATKYGSDRAHDRSIISSIKSSEIETASGDDAWHETALAQQRATEISTQGCRAHARVTEVEKELRRAQDRLEQAVSERTKIADITDKARQRAWGAEVEG